jgi:hypothetical protein
MPIRPFLYGAAFEPEAIRNMSVVFESLCVELGLSDKDDPATRLVASKIIEFAQSGILDTARLRSMTGGLNSKAELPSTARATGAAAPAASPLGGDAPRLVAGEAMRRRAML